MTTSLVTGKKFPVTEQRFPVSEQRFPESERKHPVTQEAMAEHIGQNRPCVTPVQQLYLEVLHESIEGLVYGIAGKYAVSCPKDEVADLAQNCFGRIYEKLYLYNPEKAKFSTWCWRVCCSVLNKGYRRNQKRQSPFVEMPEGLEEDRIADLSSHDCPCLGDEIRQAVEELKDIHPNHYNVIDAMFDGGVGDALPSGINLADVASRSGEKVARVSRVYHDVVKPFFVQRFNKGGFGNG